MKCLLPVLGLLLVSLPVRAAHLGMGMRVGEVTSNSAIVWTRVTELAKRVEPGYREPAKREPRTATYTPSAVPVEKREGAMPGSEGHVHLIYSEQANFESFRIIDWVVVKAEDDYTTRFRLLNLRPGTRYFLKMTLREKAGGPVVDQALGSFTTAAAEKEWQDVRFTVMTCQSYWDLDDPAGYRIYPAMAGLYPHFMVSAGDTVYLDSEAPRARTVELARHHWHRMYSLPRLIDFHRTVPGYWERDDHDSWANDCWPSQSNPWMAPLTYADGVRVFQEQNPVGEAPYRTVRWGRGLQIWFVEGRDFRSPNKAPDGPEKTIWGAEQLAWLKKSILASDATFRILVSPTPIVGPDRSNKNDNHANKGFAWEGKHFRQWTRDQNLERFYVICGDRHWQYHSRDPETGLQEFSCGAASDKHAGGSPGWDAAIQDYHREVGGFMSVEVRLPGAQPVIALRHHDVDGKVLFEVTEQAPAIRP